MIHFEKINNTKPVDYDSTCLKKLLFYVFSDSLSSYYIKNMCFITKLRFSIIFLRVVILFFYGYLIMVGYIKFSRGWV